MASGRPASLRSRGGTPAFAILSIALIGACGSTEATNGAGRDAGTSSSDAPSAGPDASVDAAVETDSGTHSSGTPILFDSFDYVVGRDDPTAAQIFESHGWSGGAKTQSANPGARGYVYTVDAIPGFSGSFPGGGSRVLALEALAGTFGTQTDFWLGYGSQTSPPNAVPGNVWFQYWIYVNHYGSQLSQFGTRDKFIYPCSGYYPCTAGVGGNKWIHEIGAMFNGAYPDGMPSAGHAYLSSRDNTVGTVSYSLAEPGDESKLFQNQSSARIQPNTWTLVTLHWDTSTASGTWEAWLTPRGQPKVKVAEWISGVTPNFTWTIPAENIGGHRQFKMPTTIPGANNTEFYDFWVYLDDFAMADSESALPTYP